jgi:hypothetical protein
MLTWNVSFFLFCPSWTAFFQICAAARAQRSHELVKAPEYISIGGGQANDLLRQV